tara:strand:- start:233 stop:481 length:249 start_codon:yes stop_codon:yes gene_type:complete
VIVAGTSTRQYVAWQAAWLAAALVMPPAAVLMKRAVLPLVLLPVLQLAVCYARIVPLSRLHRSARAMVKYLLVLLLTPKAAR